MSRMFQKNNRFLLVGSAVLFFVCMFSAIGATDTLAACGDDDYVNYTIYWHTCSDGSQLAMGGVSSQDCSCSSGPASESYSESDTTTGYCPDGEPATITHCYHNVVSADGGCSGGFCACNYISVGSCPGDGDGGGGDYYTYCNLSSVQVSYGGTTKGCWLSGPAAADYLHVPLGQSFTMSYEFFGTGPSDVPYEIRSGYRDSTQLWCDWDMAPDDFEEGIWHPESKTLTCPNSGGIYGFEVRCYGSPDSASNKCGLQDDYMICPVQCGDIENCCDGIDNDNDGAIDCSDSDCTNGAAYNYCGTTCDSQCQNHACVANQWQCQNKTNGSVCWAGPNPCPDKCQADWWFGGTTIPYHGSKQQVLFWWNEGYPILYGGPNVALNLANLPLIFGDCANKVEQVSYYGGPGWGWDNWWRFNPPEANSLTTMETGKVYHIMLSTGSTSCVWKTDGLAGSVGNYCNWAAKYTCPGGGTCTGQENCANGADDDCDGFIDRADSDCPGGASNACEWGPFCMGGSCIVLDEPCGVNGDGCCPSECLGARDSDCPQGPPFKPIVKCPIDESTGEGSPYCIHKNVQGAIPVEYPAGSGTGPTLEWYVEDPGYGDNWLDPDKDLVTYSVYLGTAPGSMPLRGTSSGTIRTAAALNFDIPFVLNRGTTYYWRIIASDGSSSTWSNIWTFTTEPEIACNPDTYGSATCCDNQAGLNPILDTDRPDTDFGLGSCGGGTNSCYGLSFPDPAVASQYDDLCCQDDSNEFYQYKKRYTNPLDAHIAWPENPNDKACCDDDGDCVAGNNCYYDGQMAANLNPGGHDNVAKCSHTWGDPQGGRFLDIDYTSASQCQAAGVVAGQTFGWTKAGEMPASSVGEYGTWTNGGDEYGDGTECCGDDTGEFFINNTCGDGAHACCNDPNDKVYKDQFGRNICVASCPSIGHIRIQGPSGLIKLNLIPLADAIARAKGVIKVALSAGDTGSAADLVETSDPAASPVRVRTPYGTKSWRKIDQLINLW